jgi:ssDNA thymidine ADP-ribosyltransferase, DarT
MTTPIYHITSLENLPLILSNSGLMSKSRLTEKKLNYTDIAYQNIQDRRAQTPVPCGKKGMLHDYVPFYFAPRSPMLYAIHNKTVPEHQSGQAEIIHLESTAESVETTGIPFVFTDGHAAMRYSNFYDTLDQLNSVDWEVMKLKYWADTQEDGDRKRRRQAEFLVFGSCPWAAIRQIGVINNQIKQKVEEILRDANSSTAVKVYANWYY